MGYIKISEVGSDKTAVEISELFDTDALVMLLKGYLQTCENLAREHDKQGCNAGEHCNYTSLFKPAAAAIRKVVKVHNGHAEASGKPLESGGGGYNNQRG